MLAESGETKVAASLTLGLAVPEEKTARRDTVSVPRGKLHFPGEERLFVSTGNQSFAAPNASHSDCAVASGAAEKENVSLVPTLARTRPEVN